MLKLSNSFKNISVMSLRTGAPVAKVLSPIIDPNNLKIEGFYCADSISRNKLVLLVQDIREQSNLGFIVNDHDVLTDPKDLVRLKSVMELNFVVIDKSVHTTDKKRLGKVTDYAVDISSMYIQKIYVGQSVLKSFSGGQLSIDRSQITEVTNSKIVVNDPLQGKQIPLGSAVPVA